MHTKNVRRAGHWFAIHQLTMQSSYPEEIADRAWDNTGLLLDNIATSPPPKPVVLLTNDLTSRVADEAIRKDASVIVTYRAWVGAVQATIQTAMAESLRPLTRSRPHHLPWPQVDHARRPPADDASQTGPRRYCRVLATHGRRCVSLRTQLVAFEHRNGSCSSHDKSHQAHFQRKSTSWCRIRCCVCWCRLRRGR